MTDTLPRTGITVPSADKSDPVHPVADLRSMATWIEDNGLLVAQGALGSRPPPGVFGRFYRATDDPTSPIIFYDDGIRWTQIGATAPTDGSAATPSLRTLGAGSTQAAAGNHGHGVAAIVGLDTYLDPWLRPGGFIDDSARGGTRTPCSVGTTTVVAVPSSGRRVVKNLFVVGAASAVVSLDLNGTVFWKGTFTSAGYANIDCTFPVLPADSTGVRAVVTGAAATVTPTYGDRADTLVERHGLLSSASASGTLVAASTARTVTHLWVFNAGSASATFSVSVGGVVHFPSITVGVGGFLSHESPLRITSSEAVTFVGDGVNALTYLAAGR